MHAEGHRGNPKSKKYYLGKGIFCGTLRVFALRTLRLKLAIEPARYLQIIKLSLLSQSCLFVFVKRPNKILASKRIARKQTL
jgi:hypothetical protein